MSAAPKTAAQRHAQVTSLLLKEGRVLPCRVIAEHIGMTVGSTGMLLRSMRDDGKVCVTSKGHRSCEWGFPSVVAEHQRKAAQAKAEEAARRASRCAVSIQKAKNQADHQRRLDNALAADFEWADTTPTRRIVEAGQWRAEPIRTPNSVFALGAA